MGSVPFAQVLARFNGIDLREVGSGNVGAGNLRNQTNWKWGVAAALLDIAKGAIPVLIAREMGLGPGASGLAGLAAVAGHNWSIIMKGRSGRGLATSAGLLLALDPVLVVWVAGWSIAGIKIGGGLGGFLGWALLPVVAAAMQKPGTETFLLALLSLVVMARRVQGNPGDEAGIRPAMERVMFDKDRAEALEARPDAAGATPDDLLRP